MKREKKSTQKTDEEERKGGKEGKGSGSPLLSESLFRMERRRTNALTRKVTWKEKGGGENGKREFFVNRKKKREMTVVTSTRGRLQEDEEGRREERENFPCATLSAEEGGEPSGVKTKP